jgi:hypothetical protein
MDGTKPRRRTRAEAARENGRKGGRPRAKLHIDDFEQLGAPPVEVLALFRWFAAVTLVEIERAKRSRSHKVLTEEIRATVSATRGLHGPVTRAAALELVETDAVKAENPAPTGPGEELVAAVWVARQLAAHLWACLIEPDTAALKQRAATGAIIRQLARAWAMADPPDVAVEAARRLRERRKQRAGGRTPTAVTGARTPLRAGSR